MSLKDFINQQGTSVFFNEQGRIWKSIEDGPITTEKTLYTSGHTLLTPHNGRNRQGLAEIYDAQKHLFTVSVLDSAGQEERPATVYANEVLTRLNGSVSAADATVVSSLRNTVKNAYGARTL